jgi:hypothetical protein
MNWRSKLRLRTGFLAGLVLVLVVGCGGPGVPQIVDLADGQPVDDCRMLSLSGARDGDQLPVEILFEGPQGRLLMDLRFRIGVPTHLESGRYRWERDETPLEGAVRERAVTFLGGQSDHPSLGGVFDLLSASGSPIYKVSIPTGAVSPPTTERITPRPSH